MCFARRQETTNGLVHLCFLLYLCWRIDRWIPAFAGMTGEKLKGILIPVKVWLGCVRRRGWKPKTV
jgi:hypothetical protein